MTGESCEYTFGATANTVFSPEMTGNYSASRFLIVIFFCFLFSLFLTPILRLLISSEGEYYPNLQWTDASNQQCFLLVNSNDFLIELKDFAVPNGFAIVGYSWEMVQGEGELSSLCNKFLFFLFFLSISLF